MCPSAQKDSSTTLAWLETAGYCLIQDAFLVAPIKIYLFHVYLPVRTASPSEPGLKPWGRAMGLTQPLPRQPSQSYIKHRIGAEVDMLKTEVFHFERTVPAGPAMRVLRKYPHWGPNIPDGKGFEAGGNENFAET